MKETYEKTQQKSGQVENSETAKTTKIMEIAIKQGNYKFR